MHIETLSLMAAVSVAHRMRKMDWECLGAVSAVQDAEIFGLNRWQTDGAAWALFDGDKPVAMGGISLQVPWVGVVWIVATDDMRPETWKKLMRHASTVMGNAKKSIPRLEAHILQGWKEAEKFALAQGFKHEGTRYRAGRDGQNIMTFVYEG